MSRAHRDSPEIRNGLSTASCRETTDEEREVLADYYKETVYPILHKTGKVSYYDDDADLMKWEQDDIPDAILDTFPDDFRARVMRWRTEHNK